MTAAFFPKELGQMIDWRRVLHANPEVSGNEIQTRDFILHELEKLDIAAQTFSNHTGVLANDRRQSIRRRHSPACRYGCSSYPGNQ